MTLNLKLSAIKLLLTELQPMEAKAAVYLMGPGAKGIPDHYFPLCQAGMD